MAYDRCPSRSGRGESRPSRRASARVESCRRRRLARCCPRWRSEPLSYRADGSVGAPNSPLGLALVGTPWPTSLGRQEWVSPTSELLRRGRRRQTAKPRPRRRRAIVEAISTPGESTSSSAWSFPLLLLQDLRDRRETRRCKIAPPRTTPADATDSNFRQSSLQALPGVARGSYGTLGPQSEQGSGAGTDPHGCRKARRSPRRAPCKAHAASEARERAYLVGPERGRSRPGSRAANSAGPECRAP